MDQFERELAQANGYKDFAKLDKIRCGNFTSSDIVRLCGSKKVRETYIHEKNIERRLGRVLKNEYTSQAMAWGHLIEYWGYPLLGKNYSLVSLKTLQHPTVKSWLGTPDALNNLEPKAVADIKGLELKNFCDMVDAGNKGGIAKIREDCEDGEKFYYQIVSNACLTGSKYGELILICPYQSQLDDVRAAASRYDGPDPGRFERFPFKSDDQLTYLPDGGYYKNINIFRFEIPSQDKCLLHDRVVESSKELIEFITPITV